MINMGKPDTWNPLNGRSKVEYFVVSESNTDVLAMAAEMAKYGPYPNMMHAIEKAKFLIRKFKVGYSIVRKSGG